MTRIKLMGGMLAVILVAAPTLQSNRCMVCRRCLGQILTAAAAGVPVLWALDEGRLDS